MATYSTNLALTLLATGEGAGTWGDTTNTNLGTLLEQSISGYVSESLTAGTTLTLTIPNGATGVARNMYLEFTGTGSTVIVPSNKKLYFVYNNCASGTISFKVSGQTGVSVSAGDKKILVSNGTDIVEATTYITSSAGNLTVTNLSATSLTVTNNASINGIKVGKGISSGSYNTVVGDTAGNALTTPSEITLFGYRAGAGVTTGNGNTFFGANAGDAVTTGAYNTALGDNAYPTGNYTNSIALGLDAAISGNNYGKIGDGDVDVYAKSFNNTSDSRDKADIQTTNLGLNFIMALQPRMYRWDMREFYKPARPGPDATEAELDAWREACKLSNLTHDGTHKRNRFHQGLVAQEVKQVLTTLGVDFGGFRDCEVGGGDAQMGLEYTQFIAPLIKAIQELKAEFDAYKSTHP
jgi:hypothetical protein